jgi:polyhydroxyalkanoate synthase subunit PhaC
MFATRRTVESSISQTRRRGVLRGRDLARVFAWVRPNDLVWNYWVSNYLLGEDPPAFDVLAWNNDATNLPAALHAEFVHLFLDNALLEPGKLSVLGTPIDLSKVVSELYVIGATTDHLVPWQAAYVATQVYGGKSRYVLSNSGHIQALINPPGNPKASFLTSDETPPTAEIWLKGATRYTGSWWTDWAEWTTARSGEEREAPTRLGNDRYVASDRAPGRYAVEK